MKMDMLEIIRKGLDVEFEEVFSRKMENTNIVYYKFTKERGDITMLSFSVANPFIWYFSNEPNTLGSFIQDKSEIIREPFKPKSGDRMYYVNTIGEVSYDNFYKDEEYSLLMYKNGNCYSTAERAEKDKSKWLNYYKEIQDGLK